MPRWRGRFRAAARRFRRIAPHAAAFGGARGLTNAAGATLGLAFPEIAIPLAIAGGVAHEIQNLPRQLREFAEHIRDANRELVPFAPRLALAEVQLQMGDFRRTLGLARETEPTAVTLTQSINEMRTALFPFQVAGRNAQNMLGTAAAGVTTGGANQLQPLADLGEHLRRALDPTGERTQAVAEAVGAAIVNTITGYLGPIVNQINQLLGVQQIKPGAGVQGPWDAMILQEAGPNRMQPLHGLNRPFNPAERFP
jgi:hypothetical protein